VPAALARYTRRMRRRQWLTPVAWAASVVLATAVGVWASRAALEPAPIVGRDEAALYTVTQGTLSRVLSFTAEARWDSLPLGRNAGSGTVTTVDVHPGDWVEQGRRLYTVDLRPVIAAVGDIPAFRNLATGVRGSDVEQLQRFLTATGHYEGQATGTFDAATGAAVRAWQVAAGVDEDGIIRRSDLMFIPKLPARVAPTNLLQVGTLVSGGEMVLERLSPTPTFTITLGRAQADLVPLVATVVVHHASGSWEGRIASSRTTPDGELVLTLGGPDATPLCSDQCGVVPIAEAVLYTADLVAVPETTGPVVPLSALRSSPDGSVTVLTDDGREAEVHVVAAAEGRAVVSGIQVGTVIRLFGEQAAGDEPEGDAQSP
jgi:peptidoglycan hydrolase-like protein with peptidoglycan-binding domain